MRSHRIVFLLGTLTALSACSSDKPSGVTERIEGTYTLTSVNNQSLPFIVEQGTSGGVPFKTEIVSGTATLNANHTYSLNFAVHETVGSTLTTDNFGDNGGWTQNGSSLSLSSGTGLNLNATISGKTITATVPLDLFTSLTVVFTKT